MADRNDVRALRNILQQAHLIISNPMPLGAQQRAAELLRAAIALSGGLMESKRANPGTAAILGAKGGKQTAKRGPEYFRKIAAMRKTRAGGRPKST